jgi:hypothetical protein
MLHTNTSMWHNFRCMTLSCALVFTFFVYSNGNHLIESLLEDGCNFMAPALEPVLSLIKKTKVSHRSGASSIW